MLHAATRTCPAWPSSACARPRLFDTELAGRLLGYARVGLGADRRGACSGCALEKDHSAADWSTRPLPEPWLRYAALDVEVLVELRDALEAELERQGKLDWAERGVRRDRRRAAAPPPRADPWRRTSGHPPGPRAGAQLAVVRALWEARDALARRRDVAPGRILPDTRDRRGRAGADPPRPSDLAALPASPAGAAAPARATLVGAIAAAARAAGRRLPPSAVAGDGPPPPQPLGGPGPGRRRPAGRAPARRSAELADAASASRWRTCSPPTSSAGWPGSAARRTPSAATARSRAVLAAGASARPWQVAADRDRSLRRHARLTGPDRRTARTLPTE